jgi:hypothetical protein
MNIALSISHDTTTRITRAVLIGLSEEDQESLSWQLTQLSNYSFHPLLLPTLLSCRHEILLHEQVNLLYTDLLVYESLSGQTIIASPDFEVPENANIGESALTKRALTIAQVALPSASEVQALIQGIELIRQSIVVVDELYATNSNQPEHSGRTELKAATASKILGDYLDCCSARAHTALWDFQFLSERANALMNAVSHNHRDSCFGLILLPAIWVRCKRDGNRNQTGWCRDESNSIAHNVLPTCYFLCCLYQSSSLEATMALISIDRLHDAPSGPHCT